MFETFSSIFADVMVTGFFRGGGSSPVFIHTPSINDRYAKPLPYAFPVLFNLQPWWVDLHSVTLPVGEHLDGTMNSILLPSDYPSAAHNSLVYHFTWVARTANLYLAVSRLLIVVKTVPIVYQGHLVFGTGSNETITCDVKEVSDIVFVY